MSTTKQLLLLCLVAWSSQENVEPTEEIDGPTTRIVGGSHAPDGAVPYLAALKNTTSDTLICGSSILNDRWILTAAHCIREYSECLSEIVAVVGSNSVTENGIRYEIEKMIIHPMHTKRPLSNDIALMRTIKKIEFSEKVKPISLPTRDAEAGTTALLAGWGFIDKDRTMTDNLLRWLNVTVIPDDECYEAATVNFPLNENNFCTFNKEGEGSCQGDSGGGLNENNEVIGVASWNRPCALGYPDTYARVYNYKDWIEKTMNGP